MAFKSEVQSRNGTLSINQQTTSQRTKFGQRFRGGNLGVASDNLLGASGIFSESPIGVYGDGNNDDVNGVSNRNNAGDNTLNVYETFAGFVDGEVNLSAGFGFSATELDEISLDYKHEDNPLKDSATALTAGTAASQTGHKKRFLGFPDLIPPDIHNVNTENASAAASATLNKTATNNFGSTTTADRAKTAESNSGLGFFAPAGNLNQTNPATDAAGTETLGQYFKNIGSQA